METSSKINAEVYIHVSPIRLLALSFLALPLVVWFDWWVWSHLFRITLQSSLGHIIIWVVLALVSIPITLIAFILGIVTGIIGLFGD